MGKVLKKLKNPKKGQKGVNCCQKQAQGGLKTGGKQDGVKNKQWEHYRATPVAKKWATDREKSAKK